MDGIQRNHIRTAEHFALHELLPPELYNFYKERGILWKGWILIPETTIITIDTLRKNFGPMVINTYGLSAAARIKYGNRRYSGLRSPDPKRPEYVSAHFHLMATDSLFRNFTAVEVRRSILRSPEVFPHINRLECTIKGKEIGWLHWDSVPTTERIIQLHL